MRKLLIMGVLVAGAFLVHAEDAGLQLSLPPDVALHPRETDIRGVSLGIWSENPQQSFTLGIINGIFKFNPDVSH